MRRHDVEDDDDDYDDANLPTYLHTESSCSVITLIPQATYVIQQYLSITRRMTVRTYLPTYIHTYIPIYIPTYIHTYLFAVTLTYHLYLYVGYVCMYVGYVCMYVCPVCMYVCMYVDRGPPPLPTYH